MLEKVLATPAGFEPATCPLGGGRSGRLFRALTSLGTPAPQPCDVQLL